MKMKCSFVTSMGWRKKICIWEVTGSIPVWGLLYPTLMTNKHYIFKYQVHVSILLVLVDLICVSIQKLCLLDLRACLPFIITCDLWYTCIWKFTEQFIFNLQVHSSPGNEGIIYALSWAPGIFYIHFIFGILFNFQIFFRIFIIVTSEINLR